MSQRVGKRGAKPVDWIMQSRRRLEKACTGRVGNACEPNNRRRPKFIKKKTRLKDCESEVNIKVEPLEDARLLAVAGRVADHQEAKGGSRRVSWRSPSHSSRACLRNLSFMTWWSFSSQILSGLKSLDRCKMCYISRYTYCIHVCQHCSSSIGRR